MKLIILILSILFQNSAFAAEWELPSAGYQFEQVSLCPSSQERIYDICKDQMTLLKEGVAQAKASNKLLVIVVGATWCPYCHSLHRTLPQDIQTSGKFEVVEIAVSGDKRTKIPSGIAAINTVLAAVKLNLESALKREDIGGFPFFIMIDPANSSKAVLQGSGQLEDGSDGGAGHSSKKTLNALEKAYSTLRP